MPPKASTRRSAPKDDKKDDSPVLPEPEAKARPTRGRVADKSAPKDVEPAKKVKADEVVVEDKAKSAPKKTRSGDLSASKKDDPPAKTSPAKVAAKEAAKPVAQ